MEPCEQFVAAVAKVNARDLTGVEDLVHREFLFHPLRAGMTGEYHGYRGLEKFLADNAETFELFEAEYDDIRELPDGRVFAAGNLRVRGVGSKVEQIVSLAGIATFRDGLLASWYDYGDRTKALAEAGLTE